MRTDRKNSLSILLLTVILSVFVLFDLYTITESSAAEDISSSGAAQVLHVTRAELLTPIRVPEKTTLRTESAQNWEHAIEKEGRQLIMQLLFCILSVLLLSCTRTSIRHIFECLNLPHTRIVNFIHRKDGKGPHSFL